MQSSCVFSMFVQEKGASSLYPKDISSVDSHAFGLRHFTKKTNDRDFVVNPSIYPCRVSGYIVPRYWS